MTIEYRMFAFRKVREKMKYLKKTAAFLLCLIAAVSVCTPAYTAYAEDDIVVIGYDDEVVKYEEELSDPIDSGSFRYQTDNDRNAVLIGFLEDSEELTIPSEIDGHHVKKLSRGIFSRSNVKKLIIPSDADFDMSENPLSSALFLETIEISPDNGSYTVSDNVMFSKDMKKLICYPPARKGDVYTVPEGTEEIGTAAFYENELSEINLPSSVSKLNRHCFSFEKNLKKIDMSGTKIDTIPPMAFVSSAVLEEVIYPEGLVKIDVGAFMDCASLENTDLPEGLKSVGQSAFQGTGLKRIIIPASVEKIGYCAFGYVSDEKQVDGFTVIGYPGTSAQSYSQDYDTDYDYSNDFDFMTVENYQRQLEFEALDSKTSGDYMYITEEDGVCITLCTSIDSKTEVPSEIEGKPVTSIYTGAFSKCSSAEIVIPDTVVKIGKEAFSEYLETLTISGNCTEIEGEEPFLDCMSLRNISVGEGNGNYSSLNGALYNKDKTVLIAYPQAKVASSLVLPGTVKEILSSACCYNQTLEEADLSSVEIIGDFAFEGCTALTKAELSKDLKYVGLNAFLGCGKMESVRIYDKVETIGKYAFGYDYDEELAKQMNEYPEMFTDENGDMLQPYSVTEGFKIYAVKDSLAGKYAEQCGIELIEDTTAIGGANFDNKFLYAVGGSAGVAVLAGIGVAVGKKKKGKKKKPAKK